MNEQGIRGAASLIEARFRDITRKIKRMARPLAITLPGIHGSLYSLPLRQRKDGIKIARSLAFP